MQRRLPRVSLNAASSIPPKRSTRFRTPSTRGARPRSTCRNWSRTYARRAEAPILPSTPCRDYFLFNKCSRALTFQVFCLDVHELTTVNGPCKSMLDAKATKFGCCWESVMKAFDVLDPQAAHKWRLWQVYSIIVTL